jgi:hypothetical protein
VHGVVLLSSVSARGACERIPSLRDQGSKQNTRFVKWSWRVSMLSETGNP